MDLYESRHLAAPFRRIKEFQRGKGLRVHGLLKGRHLVIDSSVIEA